MYQAGANLKTSAYYISQYFWMLYVVGPLLITFLFPYKTAKIVLFSSKEKFNSTKDPTVFAHLTDIHINRLTTPSIDSFKKTVKILRNITPDFIVITGDITDNYEPPTNPRYGDEIEENWEIYKREMELINDIPVVEVAGNHDQFGVKSVFSHKNYIMNYSRTYNYNYTEKEYSVRSYKVGKSNTSVIGINPFEFPTGHPPLLFFMTYKTEVLDLLKSEIEKNDKSFIISHYPVGTIHSQPSSEGEKFADIIGKNNKVTAYLTGHTHPKTPQIYHQGNGVLEIIGPSNYYASKFGLVTIENDFISWTTVDINDPPSGVISYPIPKSQISMQTIFNDVQNSEIRVVMFGNRHDFNIEFNITNEEKTKEICNGKLNFNREIADGNQVLYTFPMKECINITGTYEMTFSGDFESSIEFFVGDLFVTGNEVMPTLYNTRIFLFVTFPIFFLILFIITFICPFGEGTSMFETVEDWIETSYGDSDHWIIIYLLGFLLVRTRFQRTPMKLRLFVFFSVVFSVLGPIFLFKTEDLTGYISVYGYYIDNKAISADFGLFFTYFYLLLVCLPMIILCSSLSVIKWDKKQDGDLLVALACLVGNIAVLISFAYECVGSKYVLSSIGYVGIPLVFSMLFTYFFFVSDEKFRCRMKKEVYSFNQNYDTSILI